MKMFGGGAKTPKQVAAPTVLTQPQAAPRPEEDTAITERDRKKRLQEAQQKGGSASTLLTDSETLG